MWSPPVLAGTPQPVSRLTNQSRTAALVHVVVHVGYPVGQHSDSPQSGSQLDKEHQHCDKSAVVGNHDIREGGIPGTEGLSTYFCQNQTTSHVQFVVQIRLMPNDCAVGLFTEYTIITIQTKNKGNISTNKLNYKQINKRTNKILT